MANGVNVDLGNDYVGSAYSPQVEITETATGHEIAITHASPDAAGQLVTDEFFVPNYSGEEAGREAAEATRAAAEAERAAAEDAREAAEVARQSAESERSSAESARAAAESQRASAESQRQSAEQARAQAEAGRASAGQARAAAESARASAEQARESASATAVANAEAATSAAQTATTAAQSATSAATTATTNANAATAAAQTATTNANNATSAANTAASAANTAAETANTAAAAADTAREGIQDDLAEMRSDIADKAFVDAYAPLLTAGAADGIKGGGPTVDTPFLRRVSGGGQASDGPATIRSIKGNTLRWNQLADNGNFANGSYHWAARESTLTVADGVATATPTSVGMARGLQASSTMGTAVAGHKYLISTEFNTNEATNLNFSFSGASPVTVVVPSTGVWQKCGAIWTNSDDETRILPYLLTAANVTTSAQLKYRNVQIFDLTQMFGAGNEPATVEEFTALYPLPYYEYEPGDLLPVRMEGIETTWFNQWDGTYQNGGLDASTGAEISNASWSRTGFIPVFPQTEYYLKSVGNEGYKPFYYAADKSFVGTIVGGMNLHNATFTTAAGAHYVRLMCNVASMPSEMCLNLSWSGYRNGEYEPYWSAQREIPVETYFPDGMRSAGSVYDELTETEAITRVGAVDLGTLNWHNDAGTNIWYTTQDQLPAKPMYMGGLTCSKYQWQEGQVRLDTILDGHIAVTNSAEVPILRFRDDTFVGYTAAQVKEALTGVTLHYALATPTVTPINPPLNLSYKVSDFGTEEVMVPDGVMSAPPVMQVVYGWTAEGLRDAVLAAIAPVENHRASANYAVGDYLFHNGTLCKATIAIASGEEIAIGTNVTATTVMAELKAIDQ